MSPWLLAIALLGASTSPIPLGSGVEIRPGTRVDFGDAAIGAKVLSSRDRFVKAMSPFDRSARLKTNRDVTEAEYLAFVARQVMEWNSGEKARINAVLESFAIKTAQLNLRFPPSILLLKTTGLEEGMAAYCRGTSIVIPAHLIQAPQAKLEALISHELFHIYRAYHPESRRDLYKIIGFEICPEIDLPPELRPRKITNPDAPLLDSFIRVRLDRGVVPATPVLFSKTERYDPAAGGEFFDSMVFKLLILTRADGSFRPAILIGGKADLRDPADLPDYLDQIGRNTEYIIHPEEILADNFVILIDGKQSAPSPRIPQEMRSVLAR